MLGVTKNMLADLHIHTTFSDGIYTPAEIIKMAKKAKIRVLAVTDHDNTEAFPSALKAVEEFYPELRLIQGVEIDTFYGKYTVHVLGYYFDSTNPELQEKLAWTREGRKRRIATMVDKVRAHGYDITLEEVQKEAHGSTSIGRPHIARVMVNKGFFPTTQAVFDELIAKGRPCYCEQEKLTPKEAVDLIHKAGGIAVLAHPSEVGDTKVVNQLLDEVPFDGMEIWHPSATASDMTSSWLQLAKKRNLKTSGGSDFHGDPKRFPAVLGGFPIDYDNVAAIVEWKS